MSTSVGDDESYLCQNFSIYQLLHVVKRKLRDTAFGGRLAPTLGEAEVDILERDALQVLNLIRSTRNTLAPINRAPPEVLSLIPNHWEDSDGDEPSLKLTHVCRYWREVFVSCPSLWTRVDCKNIEKTRIYIERSKFSPLEIHLEATHNYEDVLRLVVPHAGRAKTLSVSGWESPVLATILQTLHDIFSRPLPLLKKLKIEPACNPTPTLSSTLFDEGLSSLYELSLAGVIAPLSLGSLKNLVVFNLSNVPGHEVPLTNLLDFFESAPRLHDIRIQDSALSAPDNSNVPPKRIVSLPNLKKLETIACTPDSALLAHLSIPPGASVVLKFTRRAYSPIAPQIPATLYNIHNLSHITTVNMCFSLGYSAVQLNGPSGQLYTCGKVNRGDAAMLIEATQLLMFLDRFDTSRCQQLGIKEYRFTPQPLTPIVKSSAYRLLCSMGDLRTLTLIEPNNLRFILALNPDKNPDGIVPCPELEKITLYIAPLHKFSATELLSMAKERESRDARLSTITIINRGAAEPSPEMSELRKHVLRVEYKVEKAWPTWDSLPGYNWFENSS